MQEVDDQKRWLSLLEDLGLPPEEPSTPAPVVKPAAVAAPAPAPAPAPVVAPAPEPIAEEASAAPLAEEAPAARGRRRRPAPSGEPIGEAAEEPKEAPARRRRRVAKPAAEVDSAEDIPSAEEPTLAPAPAEEPAVESPGEAAPPVQAQRAAELVESSLGEPFSPEVEVNPLPGTAAEGDSAAHEARRRRRRRRRKPSDAGEPGANNQDAAPRARAEDPLDEEPAADSGPELADDLGDDDELAAEEVEPVETPTALEEDADEFEDLTELNMPSWTELVASLYRPPDR